MLKGKGGGGGGTACTGDMHADNTCALVCHTCTPHAADNSHQLAAPTTKNYTVVLQMESLLFLHLHLFMFTNIEGQVTPLNSNTASFPVSEESQ